MRVLIADKFEAAGVEGLKELGCEVTSEPGLTTPDELIEALGRTKAEVLVVRSTKVPAKVFESAGELKGVIRAGAGHDNIDGDAAGAAGVHVCNTPGMNAVAVAELAMGHLINCDRRLPTQDRVLKEGTWSKGEFGKARGLKGLKLAIIGVGAIGKAVAQRAKAFEMDVVAWSRSMTPERAMDLGVGFGGNDRAALLELAKTADAFSVHVAATDETKGMFDDEFFGAIKDGAYFINTARGTVVDEAALRKAVESKNIRCGLDVWQNQPAEKEADWSSETAKLSAVYGSHHAGASTDQAQAAVAEEVVRIVRTYKDDKQWLHCVNEDALSAKA
ncbi:MAG: hypothetical protein EA378_04965 [Phycisphaerales bacterium]|nr:MAG: hypothetical protein EA378_04965 [Phycisphaerales bacterium]